MNVASLWRYPVKSLQGEQLARAQIDENGMGGDREFGIRDEGTGKMLTARREPQLLMAAASTGSDGTPIITMPNGKVAAGLGAATDAALSAWLQRPVHLVRSTDTPPATAEFFEDATDDHSRALEWTMPAGRFVDAEALLIVTTASVRAAARSYPGGQWDVRRFRPNIVIDAPGDDWVEDRWCGQTVHIGSAQLRPVQPCIRCTMVTRPQPALTRDLDIYRSLAAEHNGTFGIWTAVDRTGDVAVGDHVHLPDTAQD